MLYTEDGSGRPWTTEMAERYGQMTLRRRRAVQEARSLGLPMPWDNDLTTPLTEAETVVEVGGRLIERGRL